MMMLKRRIAGSFTLGRGGHISAGVNDRSTWRAFAMTNMSAAALAFPQFTNNLSTWFTQYQEVGCLGSD
jgi:hypothetical protein